MGTSYDDDDDYIVDFTGYITKTTDPGWIVPLLFTIFYCGVLVMLFPLWVALRQWLYQWRRRHTPETTDSSTPPSHVIAVGTQTEDMLSTPTTLPVGRRRHRRPHATLKLNGRWLRRLRCEKQCCTGTMDGFDDDIVTDATTFSVYHPVVPRHRPSKVRAYQPPVSATLDGELVLRGRSSSDSDHDSMLEVQNDGPDFFTRVVDDLVIDVKEDPEALAALLLDPHDEKYDINLCFRGSRPFFRYFCSSGFRRKLKKCVRYDMEMEKLWRLAAPFFLHSTVEDVCDLLETIVLSRCLGTQALSVFFAVEFILTLATMLLQGILSGLPVLCSHVNNNAVLMGRHVQTAILIHQAVFLPLALVGWWTFGDIASWLGVDADIALVYARYACAVEIISAYDDAFCYVLDVIGLENFSAIVCSLRSLTSLGLVMLVLMVPQSPKLWMVGAVHLGLAIVYFIVTTTIVVVNRWLDPKFWKGALRTACWKDSRTASLFVNTALPLSFGYAVEYCEWELLFLFAAAQGPAELAVWGLLGVVWEVAENISAGFADAAEVRVAQLLGRGQPAEARHSAHKSLFFGVLASVVVAVVLVCLSPWLPLLITTDSTLQAMLQELVPQLSFGIAALSFGTMSWSILCAQGRASVATFLCLLGSVGVTLPLACFSMFALNLNLQGLLTSVVLGYATSGALISFIMVSTNWKKISDNMNTSMKGKSSSKGGDAATEADSCSVGDLGYDDYDWDELPANAREAALILGFSEESWNRDLEVEASNKDWDELTSKQQNAATILGYDSAKWNSH